MNSLRGRADIWQASPAADVAYHSFDDHEIHDHSIGDDGSPNLFGGWLTANNFPVQQLHDVPYSIGVGQHPSQQLSMFYTQLRAVSSFYDENTPWAMQGPPLQTASPGQPSVYSYLDHASSTPPASKHDSFVEQIPEHTHGCDRPALHSSDWYPSSELPPDLFAGVRKDRLDPPTSQVGGKLRQQSPRFKDDLYTATWVRGEGAQRAGWCGYCSSWHTLKDSAYWVSLQVALFSTF